MSAPVSRPVDHHPDDEEIRLVERPTTRQSALGVLVAAALLGVGVATGDQDWTGALTTGLVAGTAGGVVGLLGIGPLHRGMDRVERFVPAQVVRTEPSSGGWLWPAVVYAAIAVCFGLVREEYALPGVLALTVSVIYAAEGRTIRSWERERRGRLGSVSHPARRRRPFRTPEYVLVVDDPARADAQAASSSSVALSGAPSK